MGGGGNSGYSVQVPAREENPYTSQLAAMASNLWGQTAPIRTSFTDQYFMPFLQGNYNPETLPAFSPLYNLNRQNVEGQYNVAKDNILANTPRGGSMTNALAGLEKGRADTLGTTTNTLSSGLINDLWNKAYNTGWVTAPAQAMGGMGGAATTEQSSLNNYLGAEMQAQQLMAQQYAANNAQNQQGKTSGMGLLGTGLGAAAALGSTAIGSGSSTALSGLTSGKGEGGITSGLGGWSQYMAQANPMEWK